MRFRGFPAPFLIGFALILTAFFSPFSTAAAQTNDLFHQSPTYPLKHAQTVLVTGEVEKDTTVTLAGLPLRSVAVKETILDGDKPVFRGAYRYDGYSLTDILDQVEVKKKNAKEYPRKIDLYIEVSNDDGEKAVFAWGEIFYPSNMHRILIATAVSRFVPSLTKDLWPLPESSMLVAGTDFLTVRGVRNPTKIMVKSFDMGKDKLGESAMKADSIKSEMRLRVNGALVGEFGSLPNIIERLTCRTTLYGQGKGYLGSPTITGVPLSAFLAGKIPFSSEALREGLAAFIAFDGYRAVFSLSELVNRNDFRDILLIEGKGSRSSASFSLFPAGDFFTDRSVNEIKEIDLRIPEKR